MGPTNPYSYSTVLYWYSIDIEDTPFLKKKWHESYGASPSSIKSFMNGKILLVEGDRAVRGHRVIGAKASRLSEEQLQPSLRRGKLIIQISWHFGIKEE